MKKIFLIALVVGASFASQAQRITDHQFNSWWTYVGNHKLSDKFSIYSLYSFRRNEFLANWQQSLLRLGLTYKIAPNLSFTLGGDWVVTFPYGKQPIAEKTPEYRLYGHFIYKNSIGRVNVAQRFRLEHQYIQLSSGTFNVSRFRYKLVLQVPINNSKVVPGTFFGAAFDEMFMNFGKKLEVPVFNQNWAFAGVGYKFTDKFSLIIGYMNQYIIKPDDVHIESNHTLSTVIAYNLR